MEVGVFIRRFSTLIAALVLLAGAAGAAVIDVQCVNVVEDTVALNSAISKSKAGDSVRIHGTCLVNATIILYGDRSYIGDSRTGTVIRQANGANLPALVASDSWDSNAPGTGRPIRIAHLGLDGNRANNANTSNLVIRSWLTVIEDLQVRNAPVDGIRLTNLGKDGKTGLTSTQVNGRISNCFIDRSGANGIHVLDTQNAVTYWDLLDSWIAGSGESSIYMDNAAGWKVSGNHLYGVQHHGIWAHRCWGTTIENNYIEGFGEAGGEGKTWYGIAATIQGGTGSVISGNKVFRQNAKAPTGAFVYVGVPKVSSGTGVLNVVNNVIRGAGTPRDTGLSYEAGVAAGLQVLSNNNNVQSVGTPRTLGPKVTLVNPL
jgi:parallel beta-helix repeat protein